MRTILLLATLTALFGAASGCSTTRNGGLAGSRLSRLLPPDGTDDPGTDGSSDPWIAEAATEGRREYAVEKATEPVWFRKLTMSDRAREIERNCGIVE